MNPLIIVILILVAALLALLFFYCELKTKHRHLRNYAVCRLQYLINQSTSNDSAAFNRRAELLDALNSTPARLDK